MRAGNGHVNAQQDPAQAPDRNEEIEANLDDDMEEAMEGVDMFDCLLLFLTFHTAIGLRGPILTVLQNIRSMLLSLINCLGGSYDICVGYNHRFRRLGTFHRWGIDCACIHFPSLNW